MTQEHFSAVVYKASWQNNIDIDKMEESGLKERNTLGIPTLNYQFESGDFSFSIDFEKVARSYNAIKKQKVIELAKEFPLHALLGILEWPLWRLSSKGRSYVKGQKEDRKFFQDEIAKMKISHPEKKVTIM